MQMILWYFVGLVSALVIGAAIVVPAAAQSDVADTLRANSAGLYDSLAARAGELRGNGGRDLRDHLGLRQEQEKAHK